VNDASCVAFLRWALPRLHLRWPGFRKVRRQVCRRIGRRILELELADTTAYRAYLETHPEEWRRLDALCWIPISRFYRDRRVFDHLGRVVLPELAEEAAARGEEELRCWSAGCASGEEPYTMSLIWALQLRDRFPGVTLRIMATNADSNLLRRARRGSYSASSLKDLPPEWREKAFARVGERFCLAPDFRAGVEFQLQDIRWQLPAERFHLVLCRNLVFTYFDEGQQRRCLQRIDDSVELGGILVIGTHESLPSGATRFSPRAEGLGFFQKPLH
jgi:chemotaxis protein methyltransferase CheR